MPHTAPPRWAVVALAATLALAAPVIVSIAPGGDTAKAAEAPGPLVELGAGLGHACAAAPSYGWPVRPFHAPHAIRGSFGDPRIGFAVPGGPLRHSFHTGVDIVAADGTPVYATLSGTTMLDPRNPDAVWVSDGDGTVFSYWHVTPAVGSGVRVAAYATVIGHVEKPWGHVHFAEYRDGSFANPLRPGALGPYVDRTTPQVDSVVLERDGRELPHERADGALDLIGEVDDPPAQEIAAPWNGLPVMPAEVRWRIVGERGAGTRWATAIDFAHTLPPDSDYDAVYAQWTRQNTPSRPGRYRVYLAHDLETDRLPNGRYRVEVEVSDVCGNHAESGVQITIENGSVV